MSLISRTFTQYPVITALGLLFLVEIGSVMMSDSASETMMAPEDIRIIEEVPERYPSIKISDIDGPRIDDGAVTVVVTPPIVWPIEFWAFLLSVYVALLVYNFSATFRRVTGPQWGWEVLYTVIILFAWLVLEPAGRHAWFPLLVIKLGLIIFILYAYLLERRLSKPHVHI